MGMNRITGQKTRRNNTHNHSYLLPLTIEREEYTLTKTRNRE